MSKRFSQDSFALAATCVIWGIIGIVGLLVLIIVVLWLVWAVVGMWQAIEALL